MEALDLGIFKTGLVNQKLTTLETAKDLQIGLLTLPDEAATAMGNEAISLMGDPESLDGLNRVIVHAVGSFVITRGYVDDSVEFERRVGVGKYGGDLYMRGNFARFAFIEFQSFKSICLRIKQPEIINTDISETDLVGRRLSDNCVYLPVQSVEMVLAA
jgi:hypothetical protein